MRTILAAALALLLSTPALAQVTPVPFVFVTGTVANPSQVNTNFSTIYERALNRYGGQLRGNVTVNVTGAYDLGTDTLRLRTGYFTTINATTITGTITGQITESQITDGAILARLAANETITGNWKFGTGTGTYSLIVDAGGAAQHGFEIQSGGVTQLRLYHIGSAGALTVNGSLGFTAGSTQMFLDNQSGFVNMFGLALQDNGVIEAFPTPTQNGVLLYCVNCAPSSPPMSACQGTGTGALAISMNGIWVCR